MVAVHAEFDQYLNDQCWCHHSHYCGIVLPANYHHQLQETLHISLPFATTGPGTELVGPSHINYRTESVWSRFFVDRSNSKHQWNHASFCILQSGVTYYSGLKDHSCRASCNVYNIDSKLWTIDIDFTSRTLVISCWVESSWPKPQ